MPETPITQRVAQLEQMVHDLAEDAARQIHGHEGPVVWQDSGDGWILVVPNREQEAAGITAVDSKGGGDA